jgi:Bardet-Biedl syndrome 2 protein
VSHICYSIQFSRYIANISLRFRIFLVSNLSPFIFLRQVVKRVDDFNSARIRLAADMADDSQRVKALVVRAEDSRLTTDMSSMRRAYTELFALNNQLVGGYNVRAANHEGLLAALKEVNLMIQRAANVRVGKAKTSVIADCRAAVKVNNMPSLFHIMRYGNDQGSSYKAGI